jgi:two-component system response regulator DegU
VSELSKITVIIADDQPLIRDGLAAILTMEEQYSVVAKTGDGLATIRQVQLHLPQLVLMDIHMPKLDGLEATKQIKKEFPDTKVLILTTFEDEEYVWEAIRHGASGFLVKGVETEKILSTIQDCLDGRINYPFSIQLRLAQALHSSEQNEKRSSKEIFTPSSPDQLPDEKLNCLSIQERNIVRNLKQGKSNSSRSETIAYLHDNDL